MKFKQHRYLVVISAAPGARIREDIRRGLKRLLDAEFIKVKVRSLTDDDRIVTQTGFASRKDVT